MKNIVILTGAGISAESGIQTFRGADGLWEGHDVMEVASPIGWEKNQQLVLDFYNQRRAQLLTVEPNLAHTSLKLLEYKYNVTIITQNIDDFYTKAPKEVLANTNDNEEKLSRKRIKTEKPSEEQQKKLENFKLEFI